MKEMPLFSEFFVNSANVIKYKNGPRYSNCLSIVEYIELFLVRN